MTTCYDVLGVPLNASDEMIRMAFCRFVKPQPDLNTGDRTAEQQFRQVVAAYEMLKDPQARATYDRYLRSSRRENVLGVVATIAIALVSSVVGTLVARLSAPQEVSGPPQTADIVARRNIQPASQQVTADDNGGSRHRTDGDRESDLTVTAPNGPLGDEAPPHVQQSPKGDVEVSGDRSSDSLEAHAVSFVTAQITGWSSAKVIDLASLGNVYADEIFYYGSRKSRQAVLLDKRRLLERWPERAYNVRQRSFTIQCLANVCKVGGMMDWQTRSALRATSARGTATFEYEVTISGDTFSILSENSSVVKRSR